MMVLCCLLAFWSASYSVAGKCDFRAFAMVSYEWLGWYTAVSDWGTGAVIVCVWSIGASVTPPQVVACPDTGPAGGLGPLPAGPGCGFESTVGLGNRLALLL